MANTMDADFREKIKQKVVRLGGGPRIIKEPHLTEAMDTTIRTIAEHKGWTWMKVGPLTYIIGSITASYAIPEYMDIFSDISVTTGISAGALTTLEYIQPEEFARRKGVFTPETTSDFEEYTITEGRIRFIHFCTADTAIMFMASLSPSQLDDMGGKENEEEVTGVRDRMPKNLDNCLCYGMLMELLGDEAGAKWADKFNTQLNRLGLLDDKSPDKITMGGQQ